MKTIRVLFLATLVVACGGDKDDPAVDENGIAYLNEMLDVMQAHSLYKKNIDWPAVRAAVLAKADADGAKTIEDVFPAIQLALNSLNDKNSQYYATNSTLITADRDACTVTGPTGFVDDSSIGFMSVRSAGTSTTQAVQDATDMQTVIRNQDGDNIKGWILDLRGVIGGNMPAMIAGIGPLLGNGTTGYSIDGDETEFQVSYNDGVVTNGGATTTYVTDFYTLIHPGQKVAVLLDHRTAVSGEGIAIAFLGRENTRSFGSATCGVSVAPFVYTMSDGATLAVVAAVMADRNKVKMYDGVTPDVTVQGAQEVINQAIAWIKE